MVEIKNPESRRITVEGRFEPAQEKSYVYVPFEVPAGAKRIEVEYTYSDRIGSSPLLSGGNTIDVGIFDPRGIEFLNAGFRGWTGSERLSFFITETEATRGYLAGPLTPGRWQVLLGLYKVFEQGCAYRVEITITTGATEQAGEPIPLPVRDLPSTPPRAPFAPWLRGELHCHSWHSDGDRSPAEVVKLARERGLNFLSVSDHNSVAAQRDLAAVRDPGLVLIHGVEVTTFKGHFGVWGIPDWVDFRVEKPEHMEEALRFARERGALTSCNHPKPFGPPWDYETVTGFDCVEVWNGPWAVFNQLSLDYWVELLNSGRRIPALCGSDWHRQSQMEEPLVRAPGTPALWVYVPEPPSAAAILNAIRRGRVVLGDGPEGAFLEMRAGKAMVGDVIPRPAEGRLPIEVRSREGKGCVLRVLDQQGIRFERQINEEEETITLDLGVAHSLYVRAELRTPVEEVVAMTNPIYIGEG